MELQQIEFSKLKISKFNMRYKEPRPDTAHIKPSVKAKGVLMPLIVRPEDDMFGVVAGRTRWFCAEEIIKEGGDVEPLPCVVMAEGDDAEALEASIIENYARKNPDPMAIHESILHLLKAGRTIDGIGVTLGKTPAEVKQSLALGSLLGKLKALYRAGEIDDDTIASLTMASKTQQRNWLALYDEGNAPYGRDVKHWLLGGQAIATSVALFSLEQYKGHTTQDLFGNESYFQDGDLFWELQNTAIAVKADALREAGWADVHVMDVGQHFNSWELEKAPKSKGGHVYVSVSHRGVVELHEGWLTKKAARKAERSAQTEDGQPPKAVRPAMTQTMENYIDLHRHAVVRVALFEHPDVAFRLLVAHAAASSGNWQVKSDPQRTRSDEVQASLKASLAQAAFAVEAAAVAALMGKVRAGDTVALFTRLLELDDNAVMRIAAFVMADTLSVGHDAVEAAGTDLAVDARKLWQPDDVFFELLRDRISANAVLAEVGGKPIAKANIAEKAKTQKGIIRDFLSGTNGRTKVEGWLPGWMEFPFRALGAKSKKKIETAPETIAAE